jgi:hypothetical protein
MIVGSVLEAVRVMEVLATNRSVGSLAKEVEERL